MADPRSDPRLGPLIESLRWKRDALLSRCAKACFLDADGKTPTLDAERLLADLRDSAKLFGSSVTRARDGSIDRDQMLRLEGRREIVLRIINLLELDPQGAAHFVGVDNGQG